MKIYNGWILKIEGEERVVIGSINIRGNRSYILRNSRGEKTGIPRDILLSQIHSKKIEYIRSVALCAI